MRFFSAYSRALLDSIDDLLLLFRRSWHTSEAGNRWRSPSAYVVTTQYLYDPYGNTSTVGEQSDNPFQYTGWENDGTGLHYYRARYYDPKMGRFISEDPIRFAGGDVNFFAYAQGDPIHKTDPFGLWSLTLEGYYGIGGGVVVGVDPGGGAFISVRGGLGIGGGFNYSPKGRSPSYDPCDEATEPGLGKGIGLGVFGEAQLAGGPLYVGVGANAGGYLGADNSSRGYINKPSGEAGFNGWLSLKGQIAVGVEITFQ